MSFFGEAYLATVFFDESAKLNLLFFDRVVIYKHKQRCVSVKLMIKRTNLKLSYGRLLIVISTIVLTILGSNLFKNYVFAADAINLTEASTANVANTGEKIYFDSAVHGANVTISYSTREFSGYAWSEDIGWVNFGGGVDNPFGPVLIDALGNLSGKAKVELGGYIDFNAVPEASNVKIESVSGQFSGFAWSEDLGWIDFANVSAPGFYLDAEAPNNPASITALVSGVNLTSGEYYNYSNLDFSWLTPDDNASVGAPAGVAGYYVYWGTNNFANPVTDGIYQTSLTASYSLTPIDDGQRYYLRIVTEDNLGNQATPTTLFEYRYDITKPTNPTSVTVSPASWSTTNSFEIDWTVATDAGSDPSGVEGYQYKRAVGGDDWSAVIATTNLTGVQAYQTGQNDFFVRSVDGAGNVADNYSTVSYYYNNVAPSAPTGLVKTISSETADTYGFDWIEPASTNGVKGYHYVINALPTSGNTTFVTETTAGPVTIAPATDGCNRFYVVAEDNSSQIDWANYAMIDFGCGDSFDMSGLPSIANGASDDAIKNALISVVSEVCYTFDESSLATLGLTGIETLPTGVDLHGGVKFNLNCLANGGSADVELVLGRTFADTAKLRAYKLVDGLLTEITSQVDFVNQDIAGALKTSLIYSITDGGTLDEDGVANGIIVDPIYIGIVQGSVTPNPTVPSIPITPGAPGTGWGSSREIGLLLAIGLIALGASGKIATRRESVKS